MDVSELKSLLVCAKSGLNDMLSLKRVKKLKYEESQYFDLLTFLSLWNVAGENGSSIMNLIDEVPGGDALMQQLQKLSLDGIEKQFDNVFDRQFKKMFGKKKPKVTAIIDLHEQETHCKQKRISDDIRGGKHKNGTNFFFKFATIQILHKNKVLTMKVLLHRRKQTLSEIVRKLVKHTQKYVHIKELLLDRGFRDVSIFNDLEFLQVPVLMPCVKDSKTRKEFEKLTKNFQVKKYYWRNLKGEYADFKLIMIRLSNNKEIGFCTTIKFAKLHSPKYFLNLYKKRWNIETGYRVQKQLLPKTTSVKGIIRYFYFCYATALHNLWLILRSATKTIFAVATMKFILTYFWISTHLNNQI